MKRSSKLPPQQYQRRGPLALEPRAFFDFFMVPEDRANEEIGGCMIVDICGPIDHHDSGWCDSYDAITARVAEACESGAAAIVLRFDSPGGDAQGMVECARKLRAMCAAARKPLHAFVEGRATSAAYCLATAASTITLSETALVGSIGVYSERSDYSQANAARGLRIAFISSGSSKTDGNPDAPLTDAEIKRTQTMVDSLAAVFFGLVSTMRGIDTKLIEAWDGQVFHGAAAINAGLADAIQSFDDLLANIASGKQKGTTMAATSFEKARENLEEAAKGDDANAAAAKRALAAMEEPEPESEGDDEDPEAESGGDEGGGDEAPATPPKKKEGEGGEQAEAEGEEPAASSEVAKAASTAARALAEVHKLRAEGDARRVKAERRRLIASRPDFEPALVKALQKADMKTVREIVKEMPVRAAAAADDAREEIAHPGMRAAASTQVAATRGQSQGEGTVSRLPAADKARLDAAMGLTERGSEIQSSTYKLTLGARSAVAKPRG